MTIDEQIRDIKKEFRSSMNGVLSAKMRESGMPYKVIFGVEYPRLVCIAQEFTPDRRLAQALWNEDIRESKILATLLMPPKAFLPEMADIWVDETPTAEVAQIAAMNLLWRQSWASEAAFQWIASDNPMRQLYGFLIMARLLQAGGQLNEKSLAELRDQASSSLPCADLNLRKAIRAVLDRLG
ncbi:MAG: DNA alkylation repair protein [Bacteroidaceae bacterium]|nr:DNA alkylation repair protein [Bacteroidaceae bacterium]